ncbi:MAG: hypothetical protein WCK35_27740 [Chloroflexota bacterium]
MKTMHLQIFFLMVVSILIMASINSLVSLPTDKSAKIQMIYPIDGTLFPPEIPSPTFIWSETKSNIKKWQVEIFIDGIGVITSEIVSKPQWKPKKSVWEKVKLNSITKNAVFTLSSFENKKAKKILSINFKTSADSVGAPIFYRDVPLPFSYALRHLDEIRWRLGYVNSDTLAGVVMEKLPACANCHSFSANGRTIAMDLDAHSGKDAYGIANIEKNTVLHKIIRWSVFQNSEPTYALLTSTSPDGDHFVSTLKDNEFFVVQPDLS